uniref:Uncharacterized protein n=1 Tax=Parasteatoda tepidariorum TaxID=114398 RepID=A0A2L2Y2S8_PARTP
MTSLASIDPSVYQPAQLLNWVYLTLADQPQSGDQVGHPLLLHAHPFWPIWDVP